MLFSVVAVKSVKSPVRGDHEGFFFTYSFRKFLIHSQFKTLTTFFRIDIFIYVH